MTKKNNPFCSSEKPSLATTSLTGSTIVGIFAGALVSAIGTSAASL